MISKINWHTFGGYVCKKEQSGCFWTVLITHAIMDIVVFMLVIAGGLLFYQLAVYQDTDALDRHGNPINHKRKKFWN